MNYGERKYSRRKVKSNRMVPNIEGVTEVMYGLNLLEKVHGQLRM